MGNCFSNDVGNREFYESRGTENLAVTSHPRAPSPPARLVRLRSSRLRSNASSNSLSDSSDSETTKTRQRRRRAPSRERISIVRPPPNRRATMSGPPPAEYVFGEMPGGEGPGQRPLSSSGPRPGPPPRDFVPDGAGQPNIVTVEPGRPGFGPGGRRRRANSEYSRSWVDMRQEARREERRRPEYVRPYESLLHQTQTAGMGRLGGAVRPGAGYKIQLPDEVLQELFYKPKRVISQRERIVVV